MKKTLSALALALFTITTTASPDVNMTGSKTINAILIDQSRACSIMLSEKVRELLKETGDVFTVTQIEVDAAYRIIKEESTPTTITLAHGTIGSNEYTQSCVATFDGPKFALVEVPAGKFTWLNGRGWQKK